jgi:hypothetical protein
MGPAQADALSMKGLSVIVTGPSRQLAVFNGQLVQRGGDLAGGTLLFTATHQVVVRKDGQHERLSAHPLVQKTLRTRSLAADPLSIKSTRPTP